MRTWQDPYTPDSLRKDILNRISERANRLGSAVALILAVVNLIQIIVGAYGGWHNTDEQAGWFLGGSALAAIVGAVVGYVYYVIVAWRDL